MQEIVCYYILVVIGVFVSAYSQILLKRSAGIEHKNFFFSLYNWRVILAYVYFSCSLFINITAMRHGVNLKDIPILESLGYVFVPMLSFFLLKEKITINTLISILFVILGVIIFYQ